MAKKTLKYPPEFKKEVCEYAQKLNIKSASVMYGLNSDTVGRWLRKYKISGIIGLKIVRSDIKKKKLFLDTINKIKVYRASNPDLTLKDIKNKFRLDCSLVLLGKKTKVIKKTVKKMAVRGDLIFTTRKVYEIKFRNEINSLYEFTLCNCSGKTLFTGFTNTKNSRNICLFIRLSLSQIKKDKNKFFRIFTRVQYVKINEFESIVKSDFKADLITEKGLCQSRRPCLYSAYKIKRTPEVIYDAYRKYFSEITSSKKLKNLIITPIINIDRYSSQKKHEIGVYSFPAETKTALYKVLKDIKKDGDSAILEFDYEKADKEYEKAYSALMSAGISDPVLQLELLIKRAELLYNTEKFQSSLMLFRDCVLLSRNMNNVACLGNAYFHLGMIYKMFNNRKGFHKYMLLSRKATELQFDDFTKVVYYRTMTKSSLVKDKYELALEYLNKYYRFSKKTQNSELIGNSLSQFGLLYYVMKEHKKAIFWYNKALEYNITAGNIFDICENIQGLINICALGIIKDKNRPLILLSKLKHYSQKAGLDHIGYEADYRMGIYFYKKEDYLTAEKLLSSALPGNKLFSHDLLYISNLYFLGRVRYASGNQIRAVRVMNILKNEASKLGNQTYALYADRIICKIFFDRKDDKRAAKLAKKVFSSAVKLNEDYIAGESNKMLGLIYEKRSKYSKAKKHFNNALTYFNKFMKKTATDISGDIEFIKNRISKIIPSK